ncbi:helix-turn-helix transcriptional regulator [Anaeromyxobacter sp. Fw109-5]|uniref:ArsR/SmtB family transcription factor n=1 Tax=Anaeromyxobacter sp. (strain Fw109-5) TaxID=404589 RepID=UPI0002DE7E72|nr:metalloregulator ArsR/SmtB family transcription factor [Anaeromyxobacter sp. Fw109-5]
MNERADIVFAAVADPTRRAILDQLARGPARVTDVAAPFAMSLNAVSKHIKVLERAGLVRRTRRGREHTLELEPAPLREVVRWASHFERFWTERLDRMEAFFAEKRRRS